MSLDPIDRSSDASSHWGDGDASVARLQIVNRLLRHKHATRASPLLLPPRNRIVPTP
ncbi:MAG: hypothetical protein IH623_11580 [Verrucomicrobia bacterium]|nr:hypothetical protein [Verrucomicrobiota bacterium]